MDGADAPQQAHAQLLMSDIGRFLERPQAPIETPARPDMPPGDPIGDPGMRWLGGSGTPRVDLSCAWDRWWR